VDVLWATKSEDVGLIVRTISFQDFQPMWSWSTNVTDGRQASQDRALHYSASRSKNFKFSCEGLSWRRRFNFHLLVKGFGSISLLCRSHEITLHFHYV